MVFTIYFHITIIIILILIFSYLIIFHNKAGKIFNLMDKSDTNLKIHKGEIPKIGGLILIISILIYWNLNPFYPELSYNLPVYLFLISFFLIGLLDDYFNIKPIIRIFLYSLSSLLLIVYANEYLVSHIYFESLDKNIKLIYFPLFFTIFCIIFLQNAFNMLDGINGSLILNALLVLFILIFLNLTVFKILFLITLLIAFFLNVKNKIFLGNSGSSLISAIISILLIEQHNQFAETLSGEKILLICFLPTVDMVRLFFKRIVNKQDPFIGDLDHFHHLIFRKYSYFKWISLFSLIYLTLYMLTFFINIFIVLIISLFIYVTILFKNK